MTMEKQPFEDVSPIKHGDFPACHVSELGGDFFNGWFMVAERGDSSPIGISDSGRKFQGFTDIFTYRNQSNGGSL